MNKKNYEDLQAIKSRLRLLLKEFELLAKMKLSFKNGDNLTIENELYLITLDHNNKFALSEIKVSEIKE